MAICERDLLNGLLAVVGVLLALRVYFIDMGGAAAWAASSSSSQDLGADGKPAGHHSTGGAHLVTPTSIPGPQALRPLLGQCTVFRATNGPSYEYCGFKSVRQIFTNPHASYYMGFFAGWQGVKDGDAPSTPPKIVGQLYTNGDECKGFGLRQTLVRFVCQADANELTLVRLKEDNPCQYELTLATYLWCGVEEEEGTRASGTPAPHVRRRERRRRRLLAQRREVLDELVGDDVVLLVENEEDEETEGGREGVEKEEAVRGESGPYPSTRLLPASEGEGDRA